MHSYNLPPQPFSNPNHQPQYPVLPPINNQYPQNHLTQPLIVHPYIHPQQPNNQMNPENKMLLTHLQILNASLDKDLGCLRTWLIILQTICVLSLIGAIYFLIAFTIFPLVVLLLSFWLYKTMEKKDFEKYRPAFFANVVIFTILFVIVFLSMFGIIMDSHHRFNSLLFVLICCTIGPFVLFLGITVISGKPVLRILEKKAMLMKAIGENPEESLGEVRIN